MPAENRLMLSQTNLISVANTGYRVFQKTYESGGHFRHLATLHHEQCSLMQALSLEQLHLSKHR
jgi:hypothetical protein